MSTEKDEAVLVTVEDGVATLKINRETRRNALNDAVVSGLRDGLAQAKADDSVRVIVLTGAGERAFCAGGDLSPSAAGGGLLNMHANRGEFAELLLDMRRVGKPIVGRINGYALGGGFGLLLACDIVVCRDDVKMGCPEINVGLFPMMIMALIVRNAPRKLAVEMMLTGRKLMAAEGKEAGFVSVLAPADSFDSVVDDMVQSLASKSPAILRLGLEAFHSMSDMHFEEALRYLQSCLTINTLAEDAAEGVMAFIQKREPQWKGR